ncbi:G-type lectin S-receptor-like serine/threonine-protein kinase At4g03230 [Rhodamnia argentea]|uniref:G-type lectin S-receptor-like serine/threonine-protein kinase At4g03230 n=1 Tax=Rhodamnia argentea TaxID=178133 RepID=A0ABM3HW02_9MYRT|nr:G-type lectin S-receptor-like serine/threonine-protein kinase At4g03230 [Rhodamnia argentea]
MSPEYAMGGIFSIKSDVYSFRVLLLEIISGKRNSAHYHENPSSSLVGHVWELWKEGNCAGIVDKSMVDSCSEEEALSGVPVATDAHHHHQATPQDPLDRRQPPVTAAARWRAGKPEAQPGSPVLGPVLCELKLAGSAASSSCLRPPATSSDTVGRVPAAAALNPAGHRPKRPKNRTGIPSPAAVQCSFKD